MKVTQVKYPGWDQHPCYRVYNYDDYREILTWMGNNQVEHFQLSSSGSHGYIFQVKTNHAWFLLRWS